MTASPPVWSRFGRFADIGMAAGALFIVVMLIVPLPSWLLDLLFAVNISLAAGVLLVAFYTTGPLQFSSFPSLLLLATLFRLALNVSATRLILGEAHAGAVIDAFGNFVIGGNFIVGIVVFIILVVIQFVVITSGAGRVAEVAARFTLDAMPGKQMAIDADLNAGIIDEHAAKERRIAVGREADFYGAMDGASKFVRGDAIAAVVMIIINILGGFAVGMLQRGMDLAQALQTYSVLTVGEGLVTQVPALLISTATGLIVTRSAAEGNLGQEMSSQLLAHPRAIGVVAVAVSGLAMLPGMPVLTFLVLGGGLGFLAFTLGQQQQEPPEAEEVAAPALLEPENLMDLLPIDPILLELGYALVGLADSEHGGDLLERITMLRAQVARDLGVVVPTVRVRDNPDLRGNSYSIKLRGHEVGAGDIYPGQMLAMNPGNVETPLPGIQTTEPAFGLPATWIPDDQQENAQVAGYTVVDPASVLITHLSELVRSHAGEILTRQETQALIDAVKERAPAVVDDLVPERLTLGQVQKVLQNLLDERISIRDLPMILEALADYADTTKDPETLTDGVRKRLSRTITTQHQSSDGIVYAITMHPDAEQMLLEAVRATEAGPQLSMEPQLAQKYLVGIQEQCEAAMKLGYSPVLVCGAKVRMLLRRFIERYLPAVAVLSYAEIAAGVQVESVGMVTVPNAD